MRLKTAFTVIAALLTGSVLSWAQQSDLSSPVIRDTQANNHEQFISANDNRARAGKLENGVLTLHLVMAQGTWYPEAEGREPSLQMPVFGEEGGPLTNPGPLIWVPEGTELHISVRNLYHKPLFVHGLGEVRQRTRSDWTRERFTSSASTVVQRELTSTGRICKINRCSREAQRRLN